MKNNIISMSIISLGLTFSVSIQAGLVNDVPSCYEITELPSPHETPRKLIYLLIDQTVQLDEALQNAVITNMNRMLGYGTKFIISSFSAYSQGRYLNVLHTGIIERPMTDIELENIPIRKAPRFKKCLAEQSRFSAKMVEDTAKKIMQDSSNSLNKSDIMFALKEISMSIKNDGAAQKVLFIVTDGLENSSITSFYTKNSVSKIDPQKELRLVEVADQFGDFGSAKVFVLGAGLLSPSKSGSRAERDGYRDPLTLNKLEIFWRGYFERSNAQLVGFGMPMLIEPVAY